MNENELYERALKFATEKHSGQFRKGGLPYITHPVAVAEMLKEQGYGMDFLIAGLFHDLLEDTDATEEEIEAIGGPAVLEAVKRLTKIKPYVMAEYIEHIRENPISKAVKACDRLHNLRCAVDADQDFRRRYILESIDWYMDFSPEIPKAVRALIETLDKPMHELELEYRPVSHAEIMETPGEKP
ncbi:MAG: HD domain-containing protein [Clostridia bacterium]|nr:HD domain-containing protein [Clostridia bacterium]